MSGRVAYLAAGDTFEFAGGQCPRTAVRELYRGDDRKAVHDLEEQVVMAGPDTTQRRAHEHAAQGARL